MLDCDLGYRMVLMLLQPTLYHTIKMYDRTIRCRRINHLATMPTRYPFHLLLLLLIKVLMFIDCYNTIQANQRNGRV